jgi:sulfopyruvate decarboxylase TPP-binding subunit
MIAGRELVALLQQGGITHLPWIPDSELGRWEADLVAAGTPRLIRVCREGEALALAAGLLLGGARPLVLMQCTGLFEAGDALRNVVHDLVLPVRALIGIRSWIASQQRPITDSCPRFVVPYVDAWQIPYRWLDGTAVDLAAALREPGPRLFLLPE